MNDLHNSNTQRAEKVYRGERRIKSTATASMERAPKNNNLKALLILAPLNLFCIVLAALAVVGICSAARVSGGALPPDTDSIHASVTGDSEVTEENTDLPAPDTQPSADTTGADTTSPAPEDTTSAENTAPPAETTAPLSSTLPKIPDPNTLHPQYDISSALLGSTIVSDYGILVDLQTNKVVASKNSTVRMYPASMTKVMTLYVAALHIPEADMYSKTFRMTNEIITPLYYANATRAGFVGGEDVLLIDYMYGTILPSGADATIALATYIAGGEEGFAELMNKAAADLGLTGSHFTNSTGLHDPNHYTTAYDMSVIMRAAMQNELCRKVLSTLRYTTHSTPQNPNGITLASTALARLSPYNSSQVSYVAGKTGFTDEADQCLVSVARTADGNEYLMVCGHADGKYDTVEDTVSSVKRFCLE